MITACGQERREGCTQTSAAWETCHVTPFQAWAFVHILVFHLATSLNVQLKGCLPTELHKVEEFHLLEEFRAFRLPYLHGPEAASYSSLYLQYITVLGLQ